jgi:hypothetical protein
MKWIDVNGLKANPDKFQLIIFGDKCNNLNSINVCGHTIISQPSIFHLGVHIDSMLSFSDHVNHLCLKASKQINVLLRLNNTLDKETKVSMYRSFIMSNFEYCPIVWTFCNKGDMDKLHRLQTRALRFVYNDFESECLLTKYDEISILHNNIIKIIFEMFKNVHSISPDYISSLFPSHSRPHDLRNAHNLFYNRPRTTKYGKRSFKYIGSKMWNSLPGVIKCIDDFDDFKNQVRQCELSENTFYDFI